MLGQQRMVDDGLADGPDDRRDPLFGIRKRLDAFQRTVEGTIPVPCVQLLLEIVEQGGLAGLAGGVQHKKLLAVDQLYQFMAARLGFQHVVLARNARPGHIEDSLVHAGTILPDRPGFNRGRRAIPDEGDFSPLLAVLAGGDAFVFAEGGAEVVGVVVAHVEGDVGDGAVGAGQEGFGGARGAEPGSDLNGA